MKIYTNVFDLARICPRRFWVAPYSDFKIGVKIAEKGAPSAKDFAVKAGLTELTPDEDKVDGFTTYTLKSADTGFVEYTIEVEGVSEKLKLVQITTDSTVFEVGGSGGGDVPADVATQSWVNSQISDFVDEDWVESQISDFVEEDALTAYATKGELTAYAETADLTAYAAKTDLTAYYTKSETSSATELADAFANVGGGAISAYDMSESPVQSKTLVAQAIQNNTCLPQTVYTLEDGSIHIVDKVGNLQSTDIVGESGNKVKKVVVGTNISAIDGITTGGTALEELVIPNTVVRSGNNAWIGLAGYGSSKVALRIPDSLTALYAVSFETSTFDYMDFGNTRTKVPSLTSNYIQNNAKVYVPDNLYDTWIEASGWSGIADHIHPHSELEAPYATGKAEGAYNMAEGATISLGNKVDHTVGGTAPEVLNITTYYESEYAQLSVDDPTWEPDVNTMYVILPDQI